MSFPTLDDLNNGNKRKESYIQMHYNDFYVYLLDHYDFCESFQERIYCYFHNISSRPVCKICGKYVKFKSFIIGYNQFCSLNCRGKSDEVKNKAKKTCLERYGVENPGQSETIKTKIKDTFINHYGTDSPFKVQKIQDKIKDTFITRYGKYHYNNREKAKCTCIERFGTDNPLKNKDILSKVKETNLKRYNNSCSLHGTNNEKTKTILLDRYGVDNYSKTTEWKENYKAKYNEIRCKTKQANLEKYGVEYYSSTNECKEKTKQTCIEKYGVSSYSKTAECKNKVKNTKDKNHTHNTSSVEEQFASWLKDNNINFVRQYKSDKYPFCCDFYFPDIDLYFEINGFWTHGFHPFDANNEADIKKLESWKQMNTKFYNNAINTWTVSDPLKVKTAKDNELNFKVIYSDKLNDVIKEYNL